MPGVARGGLPGGAGQLEPRDDHDRSGVRRRHVHRAPRRPDADPHHRQGTPGRPVADARRPDRPQPRDRPARSGCARDLRRRDDRCERRGDPDRRGPPAVQGRDDRDRSSRTAVGDRVRHRRRAARRQRDRLSRHRPACLHPRRRRYRDRAQPRGDEANRRARSRREPDLGDPHRAQHRRLEGVRARGHARSRRQRGRHLRDREPRPHGRAHGRVDHRRPGPDAHRRRVPADARCRVRVHPSHRGGDRRLERAVRSTPADGRDGHHRDEPACVAQLGAREQGHRLPDRQDRGQARGGVPPRRGAERHHAGDARELRAHHRLRGDQVPALGLREAAGFEPRARYPDAVGRRGDGDRPHVLRVAAEGGPFARDRTARSEL